MEGQRVLVEVGLAYEEERRLRVLAPVREYAREAVVPTEEELRRVMGHYAQLARELGPKAGREGGAEAIARLAPETANLDAMIREGLAESPAAGWVRAAVALTNFARISGHASSFPLETARKVARMIGETLSEAICIKNLGDIARHRMDHEEARRRYEEALPLYRRVGNVLGEASCIRGLGNIARHRMDHEEARRQYEEALLLFRQDGDALGEANCIQNLGEVALDRSDHEEAQRRYDEALPLYRWAGSLVGEANCIKGLGDIALARSGHEEARLQYEKALPLYRRGGDVQGEANCIQRLGDIAQAASDLVAASECYKTALALYTRIDQSYLIASTHRLLARIATEPNEKQRHVDTARALCAQIHRQDLVEALDAEFGPPR
jgi:tetratricopeptide (TPR) repeat protein